MLQVMTMKPASTEGPLPGRVPVLIREGISRFGGLPAHVRLRRFRTATFENGCVQTQWAVT